MNVRYIPMFVYFLDSKIYSHPRERIASTKFPSTNVSVIICVYMIIVI